MPCHLDIVDFKRGSRSPRKGYRAWKTSLGMCNVEVCWKPINPPAFAPLGNLYFRLASKTDSTQWVQDVALISRYLKPGGTCRWFLCPQCGKTCSNLYLRFDEEQCFCWRDSQDPEFREALDRGIVATCAQYSRWCTRVC
jgi:hypothetical protein